MEFFCYRNLVAYEKAREVVRRVYYVTRSFPKDEVFALSSQMRRAAVSITSNIAEGMTRYSIKDKVHFLEIAYGSLMEVMSQMEVAEDQKYITTAEFQNFEVLVADVARLISGLQKSFMQPTDGQTALKTINSKLKTSLNTKH